MTTKNNVINFPKKKRSHPPATEAEVSEQLDFVAKDYSKLTVVTVVDALIGDLERHGFEVEDRPELAPYVGYVIESIEALLYASYGIKHRLHEPAIAAYGDIKDPLAFIFNAINNGDLDPDFTDSDFGDDD